MPIVYLVLSVICSSIYSIFVDIVSARNKDSKNASLVFNVIICFSACLCWSIYSICKPGFDVKILPYSLIMGICMFAAFLFNQLALKEGKVSIVSLLISFSLVLVGVYGLIFWGQEFTPLKIVGLVLVAVSLFFIIYKKDTSGKKKYLWFIFAIIAMIANGFCSIVQKTEQIDLKNLYGPQFMCFATLFATIFSSVFLLIRRKKIEGINLKRDWYIPAIAGVANFLLNLFVILLASTNLSTTLIYPTISMAIILVIVYAFFFKHEKISLFQTIGIVIGITAVVLLSF